MNEKIIDDAKVEEAKKEVLLALNNNLLQKLHIMFKHRDKLRFKSGFDGLMKFHFSSIVYDTYKEIVNEKTASKLEEIDNKIDTLSSQLKANYHVYGLEEYGLQYIGKGTLRGKWVDEEAEYDGYFTNYYYYFSYYPEIGFVEEGNECGFFIKVDDHDPDKIREALGDTRRHKKYTAERFMEKNNHTLQEIHKCLQEKIRIITQETNPKNERDRELCEKFVQFFSIGINSIKPPKGIVDEKRSELDAMTENNHPEHEEKKNVKRKK